MARSRLASSLVISQPGLGRPENTSMMTLNFASCSVMSIGPPRYCSIPKQIQERKRILLAVPRRARAYDLDIALTNAVEPAEICIRAAICGTWIAYGLIRIVIVPCRDTAGLVG